MPSPQQNAANRSRDRGRSEAMAAYPGQTIRGIEVSCTSQTQGGHRFYGCTVDVQIGGIDLVFECNICVNEAGSVDAAECVTL